MNTCTSMVNTLTEIKPIDTDVNQNANKQRMDQVPLNRANVASIIPIECQKTNFRHGQLPPAESKHGKVRNNMIDTSKIKREVTDTFDIESMVDTINRNVEREHDTNNMLSNNKDNIEMLIETVHKSGTSSENVVVKSEPIENCSNSMDDIESLVEIFSRKPNQVIHQQSSKLVKPPRSFVGLRLAEEKENENRQLVDNLVRNCDVVLDKNVDMDYEMSAVGDSNINDISSSKYTTDVMESSGDKNTQKNHSSSNQKTDPRQKIQKVGDSSQVKKKHDQKDNTNQNKSTEKKIPRFVFDPVTKTLKLNLNREQPLKPSVQNKDKKDSSAESGKRKAVDEIMGDEHPHKKPRKTADENKNKRIVPKKSDQNDRKSGLDDSQSTETDDNSEDNIRKFRFTCKICGMGFMKSQTFASHIRVYHNKDNHNKNDKIASENSDQDETKSHSDDAQSTDTNPDDVEKFRYTCKICEMVFIKSQTFASHMRVYHKANCKDNGNIVRRFSVRNKVKRNHVDIPKIRFRCKTCGMGFTKSQTFAVHIRFKHKKKVTPRNGGQTKEINLKPSAGNTKKFQFKCKICGMCFMKCQKYASHIRYKHKPKVSLEIKSQSRHSEDNIKKFKCKFCSMGFTKSQTFAAHIRVHHKEKVTLLRCQICEKKFNKSSELEEHVKVHNRRIVKTLRSNSPKSDEKNERNLNDRRTRQTKTVRPEIKQTVKCKICGKGLTSVEKLETHMKTVHKDDEHQNKFKCKICSQIFATARKLHEHAASHKKNRSDAKDDRKIKTDKDGKLKDISLGKLEGEPKKEGKNQLKSFPCKSCSESFNKSSELVEHVQKQHIKKCTVCKESFGLLRELVQHMKKHENLRCNFCDEYYDSKKDLDHHMKSHTKHQIENRSGTSSTKPTSTVTTSSTKRFSTVTMETKPSSTVTMETKPSSTVTMETKQTKFKCSKCSDVFSSEKDFNDHMKAHSKVSEYEQFAGKSIFPCHKCSGLFTKKEDLLMHIRIHAARSTCKICLKEFGGEDELKEHEKVHCNPENLKCTICFLTFSTPNEMEEHKETHTGEEKHKCVICFKRFGKIGELEEHSEKIHNIFNKKCKTCDKTFSSSAEYEVHVKTKCKSNSKMQEIVCEICDRKFDTKWELSRHMKSHAKKNEIECKICSLKFNNVKELAEHKDVHSQITYDCKICYKKFTAENILNEHMKVHYGKNCHQCKLCGKCFPSEKEFQDHEKLAHPDEWVKCDICQESFRSLVNLTDHMTIHQAQRIKCTECGKSFGSKKHLSSHWKTDHNKGMNFMCGICKIPFRTEKDLTTHVSDCHDKVEYKCGMCDKMFPSERKLTDHMLTHEVKFQCGVCQKEFVAERRLIEHLQEHTAPSMEFPCEECSEKFTTSDDLEKHTSECHMADVFQCGYCKCFFSTNETLVEHIVTHMASPAYTCDICEKVFKSKADFDKHQHSGRKQKRFVCGSCTFVAKSRSELMGHLKNHL